MLKRFLASFHIEQVLVTPFALKSILVRLFDRDYYGKTEIKEVVANAFGERMHRAGTETSRAREAESVQSTNSHKTNKANPSPRVLGSYRRRQNDWRAKPDILVAPIAAEVSKGALVALPPEMPVVDALVAATAVVPLFRGQSFENKTYIDAANISREPIFPVIDLLIELQKKSQMEKVSSIELYPVAPFPLAQRQLGPEASGSLQNSDRTPNLVDVAKRSLKIQRWQNARMERTLARRYYKRLRPTVSM